MGKIYFFLLGVVAGFGLYHLAMSYHVIQAESGWHLVAKTSPGLSDTYVDIREFTPEDALKHASLVAAIESTDNETLKQEIRGELIQGAIDQGLELLRPAD